MAAMKIAFVFLVAACVFTLAEFTRKTQEEMKVIFEKCLAENNMTKAMFDEYSKIDIRLITSADLKEDMKCFIKCFYVNNDVMSADGQFSNQGEVELEPCVSVRGKNLCDAAFEYMKCLRIEQDKKWERVKNLKASDIST